MKFPIRFAALAFSFLILPPLSAFAQQPADCVSSIQNGDQLGFWNPHENALMNVSEGTQQVRVRGNADAWSLFYVWTFAPYSPGGNFNVDLQMRQIGNDQYSGHLAGTQNAFGPYKEMANASYGQYVNFEYIDSNCNLQFADINGGVMGPNDGANQWMQTGQGNTDMQLAFRYRSSVSPGNDFKLGFGDVEIYSLPNYQGQAWVLHINGPIAGNFLLIPFLNDAAESIRFGKGPQGQPIAGIVAYTDIDNGGTSAAIAYDIPNLSTDSRPEVAAQFNAMSSLSIALLPAFIQQTSSCIKCNFTAVNLSSIASFQGLNLSGAIFDGVNLTGINFTGSNLTRASFKSVYLSNTTFTNTTMTQAILDGDALTYATLTNANLVGASMQCISPGVKCVSLAGMDLSVLCSQRGLPKVNLTGANLTGISAVCPNNGVFSLEGANLTNVTMTGSTLPNADFTNATMQMTVLDNSTVGTSNFQGTQVFCSSWQQIDFTNALNLRGTQFQNNSNCGMVTRTNLSRATVVIDNQLNLSGIPPQIWAPQLNLDFATINGPLCNQAFGQVDLSNALLEGINLANCTLLTNARFNNADLSNAIFTGATMTNAQFNGATLSGIHLDSTTLTGAKFRSATLSETAAQSEKRGFKAGPVATLTNATLNGADFTSASMAGVDMTYTTILGSSSTPVSFSGATLNGTNFTGAFLYNVDFSTRAGVVAANGINFSNATIVGGNFSGTNLASSSAITMFDNAVVYGSQFSPNTTVEGADFTKALFNQKPGFAELPAPGNQCDSVSFMASTLNMQTDSHVTCPEGTPGPCTNWYLGTNPPACSSTSKKNGGTSR
jgi:uncharacterized protein YjbI with pentapeptide repeats